MATAGSTNLTTTKVTLYDATPGGADAASGPASVFWTQNDPASAGGILIRVQGLHGSTDFVPLPAGTGLPFKLGAAGVYKVEAKAESTATVNFGIISKV